MDMAGYTKLFSTIVTSTIWREPKETKILWITMLALANKDGIVEGAIPGLAHLAGLTIAETESALETLLSPDQYSRTQDHEGRRIEPVEGGWRLINHAKYRAALSKEERREYMRLKQREYRAASKHPSTDVSDKSTPSTQAEADTESKADTLSQKGRTPSLDDWLEESKASHPDWPASDSENAWQYYEGNGWKRGKTPIVRWKACLATCYNNWKAKRPQSSRGPTTESEARLNAF